MMYPGLEDDDDPREETMNVHTKRRKRRRSNAVVRDGKTAVRKHQRKTGRTGMIQCKRTPSKRGHYHKMRPNPPCPTGHNLGA